MFERSCPVSGSVGARCPAGALASGRGSRASNLVGPRGCSFSGFCQPGNLHEAFDIPRGIDAEQWLRMRERKSITHLLYSKMASVPEVESAKTQAELDAFNVPEQDLLAVALGAPARQVMLRAEEIGRQTGWRDGYLGVDHGFCPADYDESPGALAKSPGRIWADLCERMPGCVARGRVRESVAALPLVEATEDIIPDTALWAAVVALGMLCSIYRYETRNDGFHGVKMAGEKQLKLNCDMGDYLGEELVGIPKTIALPYWQVSRRLGRTLPHLSFPDQSSYNLKIRDPTSTYPYLARFENIDMRWPVFGERAEVAFQKGCAVTSASFQHGPDAIAACQEHVMNRNIEGLLHEMIRLKEILERMPNAFHTINCSPSSGENYVSATHWTRWGLFSTPLSKRCPAASGLQFPPFLVMDAFLGRKIYKSFLGNEGVHLRAWLPSNHRAFIAAIEYHYRIPEFVQQSGDARLMGVLDGIIEAYAGERGFMGTHRYKVFGILEVAAKTGRAATNGLSGVGDASRPWEETHRQFSEAMKERLEPYRGTLAVEPHQMRGTFEECRYVSRVLSRSFVDSDPARSIALVTLDLQNTGITFAPGDRLAIMPMNSWEECAKVAAALGLEHYLDTPVMVQSMKTWERFETHLGSVRRSRTTPKLTVLDILRRGHLAPITKDLALKIHELLQASSNTVLRVLATGEWPVRATLGDLLQAAVMDTPQQIWDMAFNLDDLSWIPDLISVEVPRTYSIASCTDELLPSTVDLAVSRAEYKLCSTFTKGAEESRTGVASAFLNPTVSVDDLNPDDEVLIGVSRPVAFQLPIDPMAPCAFFAGGSGIAPFRSFWQSRLVASGLSGGKNILYLGVQSREKFCFEDELREYVAAGFMEVHTAFSRDSRGLVYENSDLVERHIPPRYIDTLIVEQGATVCDLVMSKKQGGLGGHLYICGSVSVFDSVMEGIRKAIYDRCTNTRESSDLIINKAFAERRIMLDVFMTPKPLPCSLPTISPSELARHTGHRPNSRMWIAVHGSVYDVTDFCPMHPGGTQIIKSNAGVDCSKTFDDLAHTNNPEVASLLTKYFIGHLAPKPDVGHDTAADLYDLWAAYLRTATETLVAHQFEMDEISGAHLEAQDSHDVTGNANIWRRENLPNIMAVRVFYGYQSRLLQGGFAALFGDKMQELVLKLSFSVASARDAEARMPDVLGTVARAKTSSDAETCTREVALVGEFVTDADAALRFQERGVLAYAARSVELDIELLEGLREEACTGLDAFSSIAAGAVEVVEEEDETVRLAVLGTFLLQVLERMARRLDIFYSQLAQCSVYHPELEKNPARTRWALVRRRIRDGSLFVLASKAEIVSLGMGRQSYYPGRGNQAQNINFDRVMAQVGSSLRADQIERSHPGARPQPLTLNAVHQTRGRSPGDSAGSGHRENVGAREAMRSFVEKNNRQIRRLSRMPAALNLEQLRRAAAELPMPPLDVGLGIQGMAKKMTQPLPTPPSSRGTSRSPSRLGDPMVLASMGGRRPSAEMLLGKLNRPRQSSLNRPRAPTSPAPYPVIGVPSGPPTPPTPSSHVLDAHAALNALTGRLNTRSRSTSTAAFPSPAMSSTSSVSGRSRPALSPGHVLLREDGATRSPSYVSRTSTSTLRTFKLGNITAQSQLRVAPTF